jgi:hypothetical protein
MKKSSEYFIFYIYIAVAGLEGQVRQQDEKRKLVLNNNGSIFGKAL